MTRQPVQSDPERDLRLSIDLANWVETGRQLTRRVALRLAETGELRDVTCDLVGRLGAVLSDAGPAAAVVRELRGSNGLAG